MQTKRYFLGIVIGILSAVVGFIVFGRAPAIKAIWEPSTLTFINISSVSDIAWIPDNKGLTYAHGSAQFFRLEHKSYDSVEIGCDDTVFIDWDAEGNELACVGWEAWIWNAQTQLAMPISGAEQYSFLNDVAWNPQGHELAILASGSSTERDALLIWDNEAKNLRSFKLPIDSNFRSIGWSPNGQIVIGFPRGDNPIEAWNALTGIPELTFLGNAVTRLVYSPDGKTIATFHASNNELVLWDVITQKRLTTLENSFGALDSVKWSPDGTQIAANEQGNSTTHIWEVAANHVIQTLSGISTVRFTLDWNPVSDKIALADDRGLYIWDVQTGKVQHSESENIRPNIIKWSPDGKLLACATWDGIYIFDVKNA